MYPIVIILLLALLWRDVFGARYALVLSVLGFFLNVYHYSLQLGAPNIISCGTDIAEACTKRYMLAYGYITIPLMTATAFGIIVLALAFTRLFTRTTAQQPTSSALVRPPEK